MPKYNNIPVDTATKKSLIVLSKRFGFGERGQGAMIRLLVNEKLQKLGIAGEPVKSEGIASLPLAGAENGLPAIDDVA